jgi:unsaturated rhamnogalacturonyl hydrolase
MRVRSLLVAAALAACTGASPSAPDAGNAGDASAPKPCTPQPTSPSDPFATERSPSSPQVAQARALADRFIAMHPPETVAWDWGEGVLMGAMMDLHRVTGAKAYADYARAWVARNVQKGYLVSKSDACPPAIAAQALVRAECDAPSAQVVADVLDFVYVKAARTDDGGINHLGTFTALGKSLWVDSLYMFGEVLVRLGEGGDAKALSEWAAQFRVFQSHLQTPSGFFVHAYGWPGMQEPNVFWGRGNGWVVASAGDYLRVKKARGEKDDAVEASYRALVGAFLGAQDPLTGLFWTVLNRPGETYLETSATALFALGLARGRRAGILGPEVLAPIQKAMEGVAMRTTLDAQGRPVVTGTSGPTDPGTFATYAGVAQKDDVTYGVGTVILALLETSGLQ